MQKLQIYYEPIYQNQGAHESLTISYYDFDEQSNSFMQKIVLEKNGEKYKIKRSYDTLDLAKPFLESLDLTKYRTKPVKAGDAYYFVKYGEQTLTTNIPADIKELLDACRFDEISNYELDEYIKCD